VTSWAGGQIPITVPPLPGEALDSWIEAYARRLRCTGREFLDLAGACPDRSTLPHLAVCLTSTQAAALARATGVGAAALTAMTLQPFDGIAVTIIPGTATQGHPPAWRRMQGSRFCPACLHDDNGRWQLTWRLPWSFACQRHGLLLADECPGCGRRPVPHLTLSGAAPSALSRCARTIPGTGRRCGHLLAAVPARALPPGGEVLRARDHLTALLAGAVTTRDPGQVAELGELYVLASKLLSTLPAAAGTIPGAMTAILAECGGTLPRGAQPLDGFDAHAVAIAATGAVLARTATRAGSDRVLGWIVRGDRDQRCRPEPGQILRLYRNAGAALRARILASLDDGTRAANRLRFATCGPAPRLPDRSLEQIRDRADAIPSTLWPGWMMRVLPGDDAARWGNLDAARAALAALLLIPGTSQVSYRQAAGLLGGHTKPVAMTTVCHRSTSHHAGLTGLLQILTALAGALDEHPSPISYTRRRTLFPASAAKVNRHALARLPEHQGEPALTAAQLRLLDAELHAQLTGGRTPGQFHRDAPIPRAGPHHAIPAYLRDIIDGQAHAMLASHGISEPLRWEPPARWAGQPAWPGIDPATLDTARFTSQVRGAVTDEGAARAAGISRQHARLFSELTSTPLGSSEWTRLAAAPSVLTPASLRDLYTSQNLPASTIALIANTSEITVRKALDRAGILTARQHGAARALTPERLATEIQPGRTEIEIAAACGVSPSTISKYTRQHGLTPWRHATAVQHLATMTVPADPDVITAIRGRGENRLRRVATAARHTTAREAATVLRTSESALWSMVRAIERRVGYQLFQQDRMLIPTSRGARFLHEAQRAVDHLDATPA